MPKSNSRIVQVESKNAIIELLSNKVPFEKICIATNAHRDPKTKKILDYARRQGIPVERITRKRMNRLSKTSSTESVIGMKPVGKEITLDALLEKNREDRQPRLYLLLHNVQYAQNIGAIIRSAFGAMADAVIVSKRNTILLTEEVTRISMGASERVPVIQMGVYDAIKRLKDQGVKIVGAHMDGKLYFEEDLKGDVAILLGGESEGVTDQALDKCDSLVRIPMNEGLGSLNVGASAAILMFDKRRQDLTP